MRLQLKTQNSIPNTKYQKRRKFIFSNKSAVFYKNLKIVVKDIIEKPIAISTEDGKKTKEAIKSLFDKNEEIEISFEGINMLISHFLNESIGVLYIEYSKDKWQKLDSIKYTNISKDDLELLQTKVIPNYKSSPSDKEIFKKIQKDILK